MADLTFEQVRPLLEQIIEQMPAAERDRLRAWLNSSASDQPLTEMGSHLWGEQLVALVRTFDLDVTGLGWDNEDPETWVRNYRRTSASRRNPGWGDE